MKFVRLRKASVVAVAFLAGANPALADDPYDSRMTPEAIARDREEIRRLNRNQLKHVQRRDAEYAKGWRAYDEAARDSSYASDRRSYENARADYARERQRYNQAMQEWRQDVAACRSGNYAYCDR